ncbi:MAG TPA: hypothetical protein VH701_03725 [Vicinamibacterales bacterium]|jgi:hypothetical protein
MATRASGPQVAPHTSRNGSERVRILRRLLATPFVEACPFSAWAAKGSLTLVVDEDYVGSKPTYTNTDRGKRWV